MTVGWQASAAFCVLATVLMRTPVRVFYATIYCTPDTGI
jgi:hypothetical protein